MIRKMCHLATLRHLFESSASKIGQSIYASLYEEPHPSFAIFLNVSCQSHQSSPLLDHVEQDAVQVVAHTLLQAQEGDRLARGLGLLCGNATQ